MLRTYDKYCLVLNNKSELMQLNCLESNQMTNEKYHSAYCKKNFKWCIRERGSKVPWGRAFILF